MVLPAFAGMTPKVEHHAYAHTAAALDLADALPLL